jgi:hypothetical protein
MPVKIGRAGAWQRVTPTAEWQTMPLAGVTKDTLEVATDEYYVNVSRQ